MLWKGGASITPKFWSGQFQGWHFSQLVWGKVHEGGQRSLPPKEDQEFSLGH